MFGLAFGGAIAQDAPKKDGARKPPTPAERAAKLMESADKDKDGKLTVEELTAHFESMPPRKGKPDGGKKNKPAN
tara:strand:+ start:31695 stop:31919 length:225 start_codon:yes stop_codon:yes gene_type:complete